MGICLGKSNDASSDLQNYRSKLSDVSGEQNVNNNAPHDLVRLFLIGTGEVGKSTIIKQMQKLCVTNARDYEMFDDSWQPVREAIKNRSGWTLTVHQNALAAIGTLIQKSRAFGYEYEEDSDRLRGYADEIIDYCGHDVNTLHQRQVHISIEMANMIVALCADDHGPIAMTRQRRREFALSDSADYFLRPDKLMEISAPDYVPTDDDIIRARDPTTGIRNYNFRLHKMRFQIYDMGGQPVERARIPGFLSTWLTRSEPENRNFILYVAALSDYNIVNVRHPKYTQLDESIALLQTLVKLRETAQCGFILFLNKRDVFATKLNEAKDFHTYFGKYMDRSSSKKKNITGIGANGNSASASGTINIEAAEKIVASRFAEAVNACDRPIDTFYCRYTCAVDTKLMETIFAAVRNDIINDIIKQGNWVPFP